MDFIKTMKKREYIEMAIKTTIAILAALVAIILMEGMIYGINLHALETKSSSHITQTGTVIYAIEREEDQYLLLYYNENQTRKWTSNASDHKSKAEVIAENSDYEIVWHAPSAFKFSFSATHWIVIILFVGAVGGYFAYRFVCLKNSYDKVVDEFKRTGTIEITNM